MRRFSQKHVGLRIAFRFYNSVSKKWSSILHKATILEIDSTRDKSLRVAVDGYSNCWIAPSEVKKVFRPRKEKQTNECA